MEKEKKVNSNIPYKSKYWKVTNISLSQIFHRKRIMLPIRAHVHIPIIYKLDIKSNVDSIHNLKYDVCTVKGK